MPASLLAEWPRLRARLRGRAMLLMLDFDGTLAPIAARPAQARLPAQTRRLLARLHKRPGLKIALVSGRRAKTVRARIGLAGIDYCGLHGLEWLHRGRLQSLPLPPGHLRALARLKTRLRRLLGSVPGVLFEDKGPSFAVHYRQTPPRALPAFRRNLAAAISTFHSLPLLRVLRGKKVVEFAPAVSFDKGMAVRSLLASFPGTLPVFIGDDKTDEAAFAALHRRGLTVRVGRARRTAARYRLSSPGQVFSFLRLLESLFQPARGPST